MIEATTGSSMIDDAYGAGRDAAQAAISKLSRSPDMLWVFAAIRYDQQTLLNGIVSVAGGAPPHNRDRIQGKHVILQK